MNPVSSSSGFDRRLDSWELRDYEGLGVENEQDPDKPLRVEDMTPEECSVEFMNLLVHLQLRGDISAKSACVLSYWAKGAGLCEPGSDLALSPDSESGALSKKFDKVIGVDKEMKAQVADVWTPVYQRWSLSRTKVNIQANLIHLKLEQEMQTDPDFWPRVDTACRTQGWARRYDKHPVVQAKGRSHVIPFARLSYSMLVY